MIFNDLHKKKSLLFIIILLYTAVSFAQSLRIPMIQGEKKVNSLAWSLDSTLFAYTDGTDIVIRDVSEFFIRHTIQTPYKNIIEVRFVDPIFDDSEEDRLYVLLVTDTNLIEIHQLFFFTDDIGNKLCADNIIFQLQGSENIKACAFTCTNDIRFIAMGYEDGTFSLFNYNTITQEYIEESFEIGDTPLKSIDISSDHNMLLTSTDNGIIYIWNNKMDAITSFFFDDEYSKHVYFNDDTEYPILFADSQNSIAKFNLEAQVKSGSHIENDNNIKDFSVSIDRKIALILDYNNNLNVFNLETSDFIGYIPNFSESPISLFRIDYTQTKFLITHEDNTIYILEISKVLFPKNASLPNTKVISMDEDDALQRLYDETEDEIEVQEETVEEQETEDGKKLYEALAMIRYKNSDTIGFRLKGTLAPGPYILGASFAAGYTAYRFIQPFYFGGFLEPHFEFPQKEFPYKYSLEGSAISSPIIVGGKIYFPFGICVYPFQKNIELFVELSPGLSMNMLWNAKFDRSITSKMYTGFYGSLRTGATYKNFVAFIEGNYDAVMGFGFSIGIGYNLNIVFNQTYEEEDPSLEK